MTITRNDTTFGYICVDHYTQHVAEAISAGSSEIEYFFTTDDTALDHLSVTDNAAHALVQVAILKGNTTPPDLFPVELLTPPSDPNAATEETV